MNLHAAVLVRVRLLLFIIIPGVVCSAGAVFGQSNSWNSAGSGNWEDASWSLGILPAADQSIFITNAGSKAVGIFPATRRDFPGAMTVSNLMVSAPDGSQNTLLLNFIGTATPLVVLSNCIVGTNGRIASFSSGLRVEDGLVVSNGTFVQEDGATTVDSNGYILLTNATVSLTNAVWSFSRANMQGGGHFVQSGGSVAGGNIYIESGTYDFFGGQLSGTSWVGYGGSATFIQHAGTNSGDILIGATFSFSQGGDGTYVLVAGLVQSSNLMVGPGPTSYATFAQFGGTVSNDLLAVGDFTLNAVGFYSLSNGFLASREELVANGRFDQRGGTNIVEGGVEVQGEYHDYDPIRYASFQLDGGLLKCGSISSGVFGPFSQSGGTNYVAGDMSASDGGFCGLSGGFMAASNVGVGPGYVIEPGAIIHSDFVQSGGVLWITNALWCLDEGALNGGITVAPRIVVDGFLEIGPSPAEVITNTGSFELGGTLALTNTTQELAPMSLTGNSMINFESGNCAVRFGDSSGTSWTDEAVLTISNWNGSPGGGGTDQIFFGNSASGLTAAQLQHIQFANPPHLPAGTWFATLLPTGELVPTEQPRMTISLSGANLLVQWPAAGGFLLQGATNPAGPFEDISNALDPFTNNPGQYPSRFFRLRHP